MLTNTFCHLPGIGLKTERRLWSSGYLSWDVVTASGPHSLAPAKLAFLRRYIAASVEQLQSGNAAYFDPLLPSREHWRMFREFRHSVAYLDIETTGLGADEDYITTIALYDGASIRWYVQGDNLADFECDIEPYRLLVTYNGKGFDVPFLRRHLHVPMLHAHIDLRYPLASLGFRGGLKGCEKQLGIARDELDGVDGFFAVLLWYDFLNHDNTRALDTLLAYNILDVVNLATLMPMVYNLRLANTPFAETHALPVPTPPDLPFAPDTETIARIRRDYVYR